MLEKNGKSRNESVLVTGARVPRPSRGFDVASKGSDDGNDSMRTSIRRKPVPAKFQ